MESPGGISEPEHHMQKPQEIKITLFWIYPQPVKIMGINKILSLIKLGDICFSKLLMWILTHVQKILREYVCKDRYKAQQGKNVYLKSGENK